MSTETAGDFNFKDARQDRIPLHKIRENAEALRKDVDKEAPEYLELVDSVRKRGILNPILVREIKDPATGEELYGLIDGLHRFNAAMDAGLTTIPAQIGSLEEGELLEAQILANVHRIETKPVQYTKALVKIMAANPLMTIAELAGRLSRGSKWITDRLGLLKLRESIQKLVDEEKMPLMNAYALSKLPEENQEQLLQAALEKTSAEFVPQAVQMQQELAKARREGRKAEVATFQPTARLQRMSVIKDEQAISVSSPANSTLISAAKTNGVTTVDQAIAFALSWVLHLDPVSVEKDKAKWDADQKAAADKKAARQKEKEEKQKAAVAGAAA